MRQGPLYRTPQPSGGKGSQVNHLGARIATRNAPPGAGSRAEAEGFEPPGGCPPLAFKVVDPLISSDRSNSMGKSSARA